MDEWRKTQRLDREAPNTSASSDPCVALEHLVSCEMQSRLPYLCRIQVVLTTTFEFLRWMHSTRRMDEGVVTSEKCWSGIKEKMPEIAKELTWLRSGRVSNVLEEEIFKRNPKFLTKEKSWRTWKGHQNVAMDEELVHKVAMGEKFVQNFVMDAQIDPMVGMDLPIFKIGGWKILQLSNRKLVGEFVEEAATVALLIGFLSGDSSLVIHNVKELMFSREGLREMVQCYRRQHFAASNDLHENPRGHSSWRESTRTKFMNIQMEYSNMRSEPSECM